MHFVSILAQTFDKEGGFISLLNSSITCAGSVFITSFFNLIITANSNSCVFEECFVTPPLSYLQQG